MRRDAFEHAVRAAGAVLGVDEVLVIGSQALHASVQGELPEEAARSVEVDVAVRGDTGGQMADLLDGSIGEASMFHATFGYYAQGVAESTATLPVGWESRLVRFETLATNGVVAWCLEVHDLWISKAVAGRPKDIEFCRALAEADGLIEGLSLIASLRPTTWIHESTRLWSAGSLASDHSGHGDVEFTGVCTWSMQKA